jgi:tRNA dimethylallyltransferase
MADGEFHPPPAELNRRCLFLAGPTAVGKSSLALPLAEKIGGEIISVDSMQVYRGLDLGTAKPSPEDRVRVRHHLIDVADLGESFDAARFCRMAAQAVEEIISRGRVPIFCGGTGLYFKAYLQGLGAAPPRSDSLRATLEKIPLPQLLTELSERDPAAWSRIDRNNLRRVVRAVEVIRLTGRPYSAQRAAWTTDAGEPAANFFGLRRSSMDLARRIDQRVEKMFAAGLVEETRRLLDQGLEKNPTAMQALGYRQVVDFLRGRCPLPQTMELVKIRTRQFARRQMTWFRNQATLNWIDLTSAAGSEAYWFETISNALAR